MDLRKALSFGCLLPLAVLLSCSPPFGAEEFDTIKTWLGCAICETGERAAVENLGDRAIPVLADVLDTVPASFLEPIRVTIENAWDPNGPLDQEEYVAFYLDNARALARQRAAISLGDFGAEDELRVALAQAETRGYRPETIRVIRGALEIAELGAPVVAEVRLAPEFFSMPLGTTGGPAVFVEDQFGNVLDFPITWISSNTEVATVDASGMLTPLLEGVTRVSATADGVTGEAIVTVIAARPTAPILQIVGGNHQSGTVGEVLTDPLVVEVTDSLGLSLPGVPVVWIVLAGRWIGHSLFRQHGWERTGPGPVAVGGLPRRPTSPGPDPWFPRGSIPRDGNTGISHRD